MQEYNDELWKDYLRKRFGDTPPPRNKKITIDLSEIDFPISPLLGANIESYRAIKKHNAKKGIF